MSAPRPDAGEIFRLAARAPEARPAPPSAALEAAVLRAWRQRAGGDEDEAFTLLRRAAFVSLGLCAACVAWALLVTEVPNPASPAGPVELVTYALNSPLPP